MNNKPTGRTYKNLRTGEISEQFETPEGNYVLPNITDNENGDILEEVTPLQPKPDTKIEYTYPSDGRVLINGVPYVKEPKPDTEAECCEKCWRVLGDSDITTCFYPDCPCHTQPKADTEEEKYIHCDYCEAVFLEKMDYIKHMQRRFDGHPECVKPAAPKNQDTEPEKYPAGSWAEGYAQGHKDSPKNQDTQAEWEEEFDRTLGAEIIDGKVDDWNARIKAFIREVEDAAEERGREQGRGEMIQNSEGFIQTALLPASAIAAAEERMVERVLGLIDAECEKIASRPCPHREETTRHEDSCALDGAQHMALTKIRKEVSELLNQLTPSKGEE